MGTRTALGLIAAVGAWGAVWLMARSAPMPDGLGVRDGTLTPCPGTPNCIRTEALEAATEATYDPAASEPSSEPSAQTAPTSVSGPQHLILSRNDQATWDRLVDLVASAPRTRIVDSADGYVHAEARTVLFRFVDDLELLWLRESGHVQVRSASRLGQGDLGVNARRLDQLRERATEAGLIEPPGT